MCPQTKGDGKLKFENKLAWFVARCQKIIDARLQAPGYPAKKLSVKMGSKYARVILTNNIGSDRTWAFVNSENGDILAPSSEDKPNPKPRGNIYSEPFICITYEGPVIPAPKPVDRKALARAKKTVKAGK